MRTQGAARGRAACSPLRPLAPQSLSLVEALPSLKSLPVPPPPRASAEATGRNPRGWRELRTVVRRAPRRIVPVLRMCIPGVMRGEAEGGKGCACRARARRK